MLRYLLKPRLSWIDFIMISILAVILEATDNWWWLLLAAPMGFVIAELERRFK